MVAVHKVSRPFDRLGSAPRGGQDYRAEEGQLQIGLYMRHTVLLETDRVGEISSQSQGGPVKLETLNRYCINVVSNVEPIFY